MAWIAEHGKEIFIFFTFPFIGLILDAFFSLKKLLYSLFIVGIFLAPAVTGYSYTFSWGYVFLSFVGLSCTYASLCKKIEDQKGKTWGAIFVSGILFLMLGWFTIIDSFSGSQTVEKTWCIATYKIEYIRDQGFAGGAKMKYKLSRYAYLPFFIKYIETTVDNNAAQSCRVVFFESKIVFDNCKGSITKIE